MPVRKVTIAILNKVKKEIDSLIENNIITPVNTPTDWLSSMVVAAKKNGEIRICIDPKPLNKALKRNLYPLPTIHDLVYRY